jgi:squalene cyclase
MKTTIKFVLLGTILILFAGFVGSYKAQGSRCVSGQDCYAVCTYQGASGSKYIGISSGGCDDACTAASNKCTNNNDAPCSKVKCTSTNCN